MSDREKRKPFIQMRDDLRTCVEVRQIAAILNKSKNEVVGACYGVWGLANRQLGAVSDRMPFTTAADIDAEAQIPGFALAMAEAGWLVIGPTWVEFPDYNDAIGSRARLQQEARDRLANANKVKAARQAERERMRPPAQAGLFDGLPSAEPEPPHEDPEPDPVEDIFHEPVVTNVVARANGNGNGNKKEPPLAPQAGGEKGITPSHPPNRRARRVVAELDAIAHGHLIEPAARSWGRFMAHCVGMRRRISREAAEGWVKDLAAMPAAQASAELESSIRNVRWSPPDGWRPPTRASPSPPPLPAGAITRWQESGQWCYKDADGISWRWESVRGEWFRRDQAAPAQVSIRQLLEQRKEG